MLRKNGKISKATLKRRRPVGKRKIEVIAMNEHVLAIEHVDTKIGGGSKSVHLHTCNHGNCNYMYANV